MNQGVGGTAETQSPGSAAARGTATGTRFQGNLEILGFESREFRDSGEHFGANLDRVVECPRIFALGWMAELSMRAT